MKNDQGGEAPRDPRHVYCNPVNPVACPVLALAIYFACNEFCIGENRLFPGKSQYDRFRHAFERLLNKEEVKLELIRRGVDPKDIGSHSFRKGCATFCSSGSTSGPSSTAVQLRAGWRLFEMQSTYIKHEGAGDQYVGRTAAGLPADDYRFCTLPPHFVQSSVGVERCVNLMFPNYPGNIFYVLEHVASLVFTRGFFGTFCQKITLCSALPCS